MRYPVVYGAVLHSVELLLWHNEVGATDPRRGLNIITTSLQTQLLVVSTRQGRRAFALYLQLGSSCVQSR